MLLNLYTTTYEYDKDSQKKSRQLLRQQLEFEKDIERENELINLYPQMTYQTLEGFGGAVTDSAGYMYAQMSEEQKLTGAQYSRLSVALYTLYRKRCGAYRCDTLYGCTGSDRFFEG